MFVITCSVIQRDSASVTWLSQWITRRLTPLTQIIYYLSPQDSHWGLSHWLLCLLFTCCWSFLIRKKPYCTTWHCKCDWCEHFVNKEWDRETQTHGNMSSKADEWHTNNSPDPPFPRIARETIKYKRTHIHLHCGSWRQEKISVTGKPRHWPHYPRLSFFPRLLPIFPEPPSRRFHNFTDVVAINKMIL